MKRKTMKTQRCARAGVLTLALLCYVLLGTADSFAQIYERTTQYKEVVYTKCPQGQKPYWDAKEKKWKCPEVEVVSEVIVRGMAPAGSQGGTNPCMPDPDDPIGNQCPKGPGEVEIRIINHELGYRFSVTFPVNGTLAGSAPAHIHATLSEVAASPLLGEMQVLVDQVKALAPINELFVDSGAGH